MDFIKYIFSRGVPKTEQVISYATGDDGDLQKGWWRGRAVDTNRTRFVRLLYNGAYVIHDRATRLMWPRDWTGLGGNFGNASNWNNALVFANSVNFAGFSDWRIPNYQEISSLFSAACHSPSIPETVFDNVGTESYWTSSTWLSSPTYAFRTGAENNAMYWELKTNTKQVIAVRSSH